MNTTQKPIIGLDIDGVFNAFGAWIRVLDDNGKTVDTLVPAGYREAKADRYWVLIPEQAHEWVSELEQAGDVLWASMWMEKAWQFGMAAGFGAEWDFIDFDAVNATRDRLDRMTGEGVGSYKHLGIVQTAGDLPFVWVDDDAKDWQMRWAANRNRSIPTLIVRPDPAVGMTREHVDEVLAFAERSRSWLSDNTCATV